jgi:uncharacterized protein YciI
MKKLLSLSLLSMLLFAMAEAQTKNRPDPSQMSTYVVGMLYRGPNWTAEKTPETESLQAGHMANINRMAEMGKLMAAGPMGDTGQLRGIFIFRADSIAEVKPLAEADPAIQAGRLKIDYRTWWGQKGIGEKFAAEYQKNPDMKVEMAQHQLVILLRGPKAASLSEKELEKLQEKHLEHIFKMLDAKKAAVAGPFMEDTDLRGIIVYQLASIDEAKKLAESDPAVKAGRLKLEIHPWWVAKGVWP